MRGPDVRLVHAVLELPRVAVSHARREWWRRMPPIPLPSRDHLAWRTSTAYGSARRPAVGDVLEYAAWRRRQRRATR